jgi:hypothetical protein
MGYRFVIIATVLHAVLLTAAFLTVREWSKRHRSGTERGSVLRGFVGGTGRVLGLAVLLAAAAAALTHDGFTAIRLLSQTLFGEVLVLASCASLIQWRRRSPGRAVVFALVAGSLCGVYAEAYHREPEDLQIRRHSVDRSRGGPLRASLRIVQLSDIQADHIGAYERRALETALAQGPDLVVMTGDYIQPRQGGPRDRATADLSRLLRDLHFDAPLGAFATRGDTDVDWPAVFAGTSVRPLSGESVKLDLPGGRSLALVGLTRLMSHGRDRQGLQDLVRQAPPADLLVVAGHGPDFIAQLAGKAPLDLALAGHTHGGQVVLPFVGAPYTKSSLPRLFASGLHDFQGTLINVSAGVGMERGSAPQIRFLCPPEISVIDLRF